MNALPNNCLKTLVVVLWMGFLSIGFWGCTNVQHNVRFSKDYLPNEEVSIKVARVVYNTAFSFDFDIEKMLADALADQLFQKDLLWLGDKEPNLFMESRIEISELLFYVNWEGTQIRN